MLWFWLVVIGGIFDSARALTVRLLLRDKGDSLAFSFVSRVIELVLMVPFVLLLGGEVPGNIISYLILLVVGIMEALSTFLRMETSKYLEASLRTTLFKVNIFWVLVFSALFLGETITSQKIAGICLIFCGVIFSIFQKSKESRLKEWMARIVGRRDQKSIGVFLTLVASFWVAFEFVFIKYLLGIFHPFHVVFGASLVASVVFWIVAKDLKGRVLQFMQGKQGKVAVFSCVLGTVSSVFFFFATAKAEVSRTVPISQSFAIMTILGGIIFLRERERVWQKVFGGVLAVLGVILVKLA